MLSYLTINRKIELYLLCSYFLPLPFLDRLEHKLLYFQRDFYFTFLNYNETYEN